MIHDICHAATPAVVRQFRSWRHSGFNVDRSVRLAAGDRDGIERLAQYMARSPFSLARLIRIAEPTTMGHAHQEDLPRPLSISPLSLSSHRLLVVTTSRIANVFLALSPVEGRRSRDAVEKFFSL